MTISSQRLSANKANAKLSTGPQTAAGKENSKVNATIAGLWAKDILVGTEAAEEWVDFRDGILSSWLPCNTMECELAEQIAALMWRSRRVIRYESGVTVAAMAAAAEQLAMAHLSCTDKRDGDEHSAEEPRDRDPDSIRQAIEKVRKDSLEAKWFIELLEKLPELPDDAVIDQTVVSKLITRFEVYDDFGLSGFNFIEQSKLFDSLNLPEECKDRPSEYRGWKGIHLKRVLQQHADAYKVGLAELTAKALRGYQAYLALRNQEVDRLGAELKTVQDKRDALKTAVYLRHLLPAQEDSEKIMRAESHLTRQLKVKLQMLERLQAVRLGKPSGLAAEEDELSDDETAPVAKRRSKAAWNRKKVKQRPPRRR